MINLAMNAYLYNRFMPGKAGITLLASGVQAHRSGQQYNKKLMELCLLRIPMRFKRVYFPMKSVILSH